MFTASPDLFLLEENHRTFIETGKGQIIVPFPPLWMRSAAALVISVLCLVAALYVISSQNMNVNAETKLGSSFVWFAAFVVGLFYFLRYYVRYKRLQKLEFEGQVINAHYVQYRLKFGKRPSVYLKVTFNNPEGKPIFKEQQLAGGNSKAIQGLQTNTPMAILYVSDQLSFIL